MAYSKISLSLDAADLEFLEAQVRAGHFVSRSAAVQRAVRLLRESLLTDEYAAAFDSWEADDWDAVSSDGLPR